MNYSSPTIGVRFNKEGGHPAETPSSGYGKPNIGFIIERDESDGIVLFGQTFHVVGESFLGVCLFNRKWAV